MPSSHKRPFVSIKHTNRLTLFGRDIVVSVRIMNCFATARCRYSNHHTLRVDGVHHYRTYVKFEDREHQGTDSAGCTHGCAFESHVVCLMRWYSTTNVMCYLKVRGLNLGHPTPNLGRRFFAISLTPWKLTARYSLDVRQTAILPISAFTHIIRLQTAWPAEEVVLSMEGPISNSEVFQPFCVPSRNIRNLDKTRPTRLQRLFPTTPSRCRSLRKITQSVRTRSTKLRLLTARLHWKISRSLCGLKWASQTGTHGSCRIFHSPVHGATRCLLSAVTFHSQLQLSVVCVNRQVAAPVLEIMRF